jgi:very-short-patch-repair endonuclease
MVEGPFRGSIAVARGLVTAGELRGPKYLRLFPDVYLASSAATPDLGVWSRAAYLLVERRGGVLGGYAAALLLGADCAPPGTPAEVIVAGGQRGHDHLLTHRGEVVGPDRWRVGGCVVTSPERTAWDLGRRLDTTEAVVALDALGRLRGFTLAQLLARREREPGARGCRRLDRAVALADPRAESPMETRLRLLLINAGLPRPRVQHELVDEHGFVVARFDLAYPDELLAVEYDGRGHRRREFSDDDRWRDTTTGDHGWHTMRFGRNDVLLSRRRTAAMVRNQLTLRAGIAARALRTRPA